MARYTLDPASSRFTVQAFAAGMFSGLGHSPTFAVRELSGELRFTPETLADAAFHLSVRADSLTLTDPVSPKDREEIEGQMRREVLETAAHPEIDFESSQVTADKVTDNWYRLRIKGQLSLHGVKGPQSADAQLRILEEELRLLLTEVARSRRQDFLAETGAFQDRLRSRYGQLSDSVGGIRDDRKQRG